MKLRAGAIPFRSLYTSQLVQEEGVKAVVALNESYELRLCSHTSEGWAGLGVTLLLAARYFVPLLKLLPFIGFKHKGDTFNSELLLVEILNEMLI